MTNGCIKKNDELKYAMGENKNSVFISYIRLVVSVYGNCAM